MVNELGVMLSRGNNERMKQLAAERIFHFPFSINSTDCHAALAKTYFFGGLAETADRGLSTVDFQSSK